MSLAPSCWKIRIGFLGELRTISGYLLPPRILVNDPTVVKTFRDERVSTFLVFSVPAVQLSGNEGWQRYRLATGIVWSF